jgi:CRP-like cAMP-binding protein
MPDLKPATLRRILMLRQFPILCEAELGELTMFAENVAEVVLPANTVVASAGARLGALHLVVTGEIATTGPQRRTWGPHQVFGGLEVLANCVAHESAMATVPTTTLQLLAPDVTEILDDSFGVMLAALRGLAAALVTGARPRPPCTLPDRARSQTLGFVERLMLLRQQAAFTAAPLESLVALAHVSEEVVLPAAARLTQAGRAEPASYVIVEGACLVVGATGPSRRLGPGDAVGHLEALAGQAHAETTEVVEPLRALKVETSRVFDIIEDHTDFGRAILSVLADCLLATQLLRARLPEAQSVRDPRSGITHSCWPVRCNSGVHGIHEDHVSSRLLAGISAGDAYRGADRQRAGRGAGPGPLVVHPTGDLHG